MAKISKRAKQVNEVLGPRQGQEYTVAEAVELLQKVPGASFDEGMDAVMNLAGQRQAGIDVRYHDRGRPADDDLIGKEASADGRVKGC